MGRYTPISTVPCMVAKIYRRKPPRTRGCGFQTIIPSNHGIYVMYPTSLVNAPHVIHRYCIQPCNNL